MRDSSIFTPHLKPTMIPAVRSIACACLAIVIGTVAGHAQQARQIAFRTLCLELAGSHQEVLIPGKDPKSPQKIQLFADLSPVYQGVFSGTEAQMFIEKSGTDGKPSRVVVAKGQLAQSERQLFLLVPTGAQGDDKPAYSMICYDDDTKSFPMGHIRAINLAPVPVRFQLSGQTTPQIPPAKYAQFPHSTKFNEYNMYPVVVQFLSGDNTWVNGQSVSWKSTGRRREIVVTLVDSTYKQPTVRMYSDIPPWLEEQPPAGR